MLIIRHNQLQIFHDEGRAQYVEKVAAQFLKMYPRECRQTGGWEALRQIVSDAIERAANYGFKTQADIGLFIALRFILGVDFTHDPQLPWVAEGLANRGVKNPSLRIQLLHDRMLEYLDATSGEHCGFVVRAMIHLRDWKLPTAPPTGPEWDSNMLDLLHRMYPEKYEHQGEAANRALVEWSALQCGRTFRLQSPEGRALVTILMFMLGSGFAQDQLHPWAATILTQDAAVVPERERVAALYGAAQAHLRDSLTTAK